MRLIVGGGRAAETPDEKGAVIVGVRTLSEGGRVGNFSREQVMVKLFPFSLPLYLWPAIFGLMGVSFCGVGEFMSRASVLLSLHSCVIYALVNCT